MSDFSIVSESVCLKDFSCQAQRRIPFGLNGGMDALTKNSFAARLRQAREEAGLNQEQLAERVGITQGQISKLELGIREESTKTAEIAHELGVNAYWLATGNGNKKGPTIGPFELLIDDLPEENRQLPLDLLRMQISANAMQIGPEKSAAYLRWIDAMIATNKKRDGK